MTRAANRRALIACTALAACFTAFSFRLVQLQVSGHEAYAAMAAGQNTHKEPIFARRGTVVDARGEILAQNEPVKTVVADGSLIKDTPGLAALLAKPLGMPADKLAEKLSRTVPARDDKPEAPSRYIVLKKEVPEADALEIRRILQTAKKQGLVFTPEAVRFEQDSVRTYPNGSMLCHIIGYINEQGSGMEGVERSMNEYLTGRDGYRFIERDRTGRELVPYRGQERSPRDGAQVRLTIDMGLQQIVESELEAAVKQYKPKNATVILMNPKTGEILALANRPHYDLNAKRDVPEDHRKNIAIMSQIEPGSTFKIVTTAAALNERIVQPDTEIFCENGYWTWCKLHDHHPYAALTVENVLIKSSNIGVAKLGMQLGDTKFYEYARKFGFGERTAVNLPGEIRGRIAPPYEWSKISLTRMPMGHEVAATPLQIVAAMGAIANGGTLMIPQIVRSVTGPDGTVIAEYPPQELRRVVSRKATEQVRQALVQVVSPKGTADKARVPGYKVAGKTGTAQKSDASGRMSHEQYVVSFAGYMPAEDPAFVAIVLFDEAQTKHGENYGGLVAAPVFARIAERAARYLDLKPTEEIPPAGAAAAKNEDAVSAARDQ